MTFRNSLPNSVKIRLGFLLLLGAIFFLLLVTQSEYLIPQKLPFGMLEKKASATVELNENMISVPLLTALLNTEIRSGPGSEYPAIAILEGGKSQQIIAVSPDRQWWAIEVPYLSSGYGWVAADQVSVQNVDGVSVITPIVSISGTPTPNIEAPQAIAIANVNIRSGPGMEFNKIGLIKEGESAEIIGKSVDEYWWAIKFPSAENGVGWISVDYVIARRAQDVPVLDQEAGQNAISIPEPGLGVPRLTAVTNVNVRKGPGNEYDVIGQLNAGQMAEIVGISQDGLWWAIKVINVENNRGWVSAQFVVVENAENVPVIR